MRINGGDSDKLIMTRRLLKRAVCTGHVSREVGNYAGKTLHPSGITSAITIIINQIYRATKAKNLLTGETKSEKGGESERERGRERTRYDDEARGRRNVGE